MTPISKIIPYFRPIPSESMKPAGTAKVSVSLVNDKGETVGDHALAFMNLMDAHDQLERIDGNDDRALHDIFRDPNGFYQVAFSPLVETQDLKESLALSFEYYPSVPLGRSREDVLEEGLKIYFDLLQSCGVEWDLDPHTIHFKVRSKLHRPDWLEHDPESIISAALSIEPDEDDPVYRRFFETAKRVRAEAGQETDAMETDKGNMRAMALSTYNDLCDQNLDRNQIVAIASQLVVIAQEKSGDAKSETSGTVRTLALSTYKNLCDLGFDEDQIVALANELVAEADR